MSSTDMLHHPKAMLPEATGNLPGKSNLEASGDPGIHQSPADYQSPAGKLSEGCGETVLQS